MFGKNNLSGTILSFEAVGMQHYVTKKLTNKYKKKRNFIANRDHNYKKSRVVAYTCRYTSGHLIPNIHYIFTGVGNHPCFFAFYTYDPYWL